MADHNGSWSGLTDEEAQEFHNFYLQGTTIFVLVAIVAHFLVWFWRPWIPGPKGYAALENALTTITSLVG